MERQTSTKYKVIFHIDEPSKGRAVQARLSEPERFRRADQVLMNITNLLDDRGDEDVKAALLANGSGVRTLV